MRRISLEMQDQCQSGIKMRSGRSPEIKNPRSDDGAGVRALDWPD